MLLSRFQEEILLILHHTGKELYVTEILSHLNQDRIWVDIRQSSLSTTLTKMKRVDLIETVSFEGQNNRKIYYEITDLGWQSLMEMRANRERYKNLEENQLCD